MQKPQGSVSKKFEKRFSGFNAHNALYFSMASFTELYLSDNTKDEISRSVGKIMKKSSNAMSRTKDSINRFFSKAGEGIEKMVATPADIDAKNIEVQLSNDESCKNYMAKTNPLTKFLKNMYGSFTSYTKKAYGVVEDASKKIDTFVKLTLLKIIRLYERILAQLNPQWNRVMGSPEDLDTHALTVSQKESIIPESAKYQLGYEFLRYRA